MNEEQHTSDCICRKTPCTSCRPARRIRDLEGGIRPQAFELKFQLHRATTRGEKGRESAAYLENACSNRKGSGLIQRRNGYEERNRNTDAAIISTSYGETRLE